MSVCMCVCAVQSAAVKREVEGMVLYKASTAGEYKRLVYAPAPEEEVCTRSRAKYSIALTAEVHV